MLIIRRQAGNSFKNLRGQFLTGDGLQQPSLIHDLFQKRLILGKHLGPQADKITGHLTVGIVRTKNLLFYLRTLLAG